MSQVPQFIIKVICVSLVFVPYKFVFMQGKETSFIQDFLVALVGYLLGYGVIYLIQQRSNNQEGE